MLLGLLVSVVTFGQTTIASQSFETVPSSPNWAYTKNGGTVSTTNTGTPTNQRIRTGAKSLQFNSESGDITFNDISVSSYSSIKITLRISSISGNSANGADGGDYLRVFTKLNNDSFKVNSEANSEITVKGDTNARWGFNASGVTTTAGVNTVVSGTSGTNQGTVYSTLTINIPDGTSKVGLRINALNDASNEFWCLDDIEITGQTCSTYPTDPVGSITVSANPACGSATLTYPSGYYWQTSATGVSTSYPTSSNYTVSTTGTYYVRNYNGTCWSTNALSSGVVAINESASISIQPSNISVSNGGNTIVTVVASNASSYQWQLDTGTGFVDLSEGGMYSNTTSASLSITGATIGMNGNKYRCLIISNAPCGSVISNEMELTVTNITTTVFKPGELLFVGFDATAECVSGSAMDKFYLTSLVDIKPGTEFSIINSRYEAGAGANIRTNKWYGGADDPFQDLGILTFIWNGSSNIPAGSIISFNVKAFTISDISINNIITNSFSTSTNSNQCNISSSDSDQIYIVQGNFTAYGTVGSNRYNLLNGKVLFGLTNGISWVPFTSAVSGGATRESRLPEDLQCFNIELTSMDGVRYYKNSAIHNGSKNAILGAIMNSSNWDTPVNDECLNITEDFTSPYTNIAIGKLFVITNGNPDGYWTGNDDTNWFNCKNWEGLYVPTESTDVTLTDKSKEPSIGSATTKYPNGAYAKNLLIETGSTLKMNNSSSRLHLYGNWTNNAGNSAFSEGNGTVYFEGTSLQVINNVSPEGTEVFNNVILNNNFNTSVSNDLQANGDLTLATNKTLTIASNDYVQVAKNVTNNGSVVIEDNGSLVQTDDSGTYSGAGSNSMSRKPTNLHTFDYVYWTSPQVTTSFATIPNSRFYEWKPDHFNGNGYGYGNWFVPTGTNFSPGTGYIFRVPSSLNQDVNFSGSLFNNGVVNVTIKKGGYTLLVPPPPGINAPINRFDDNWNLVGNPYPSAIDAVEFLTDNAAVLENGSVCLWRHINTISNANPSPYYQTFGYNYSGDDYVTYNGTGAVPYGKFDGKIAAGQAFFVTMKDDVSVPTTATMQFNNSQRSKAHNNSQFFKTSSNEKHRIWLDLIDSSKNATGQLVGYISNATNEDDFIFESKTSLQSGFSFYSLIDNTAYSIQGRQLPFDENDNVPLGMIVPAEGKYSIAIANVDGRFTDRSQAIYLEDKNTAVLYDLTKAPYEFTVSKGITNNRFVLRYTDKKLSNTAVNMEDNEVAVFVSQDVIKIDANENTITEIDVYNVLGQKLYGQKISNLRQLQINTITKNNQGLIVKGTLENGKTFTRKIIF